MPAMSHFPWTKPTSARDMFTQNFGFMEKFFTRFLGREGEASQFTIMGTVEFRHPEPLEDLETRLRETWRAMRYYSPSIATLTLTGKKSYAVANAPTLADWENATFKVHSNGMTAEDLFGQVERTAMITLHFLPSVRNETDPCVHQLVLQAEHHHIDGRGVFYFFDRFFQLLVTPELRQSLTVGNEWTRLPVMMDELLRLPKETTAEQVDIAARWIGSVGTVEPLTVKIEPQRADRPPTRSLRSLLRFSEQETLAVVAACKSGGFSVTSAWLAAIALALASFQAKDSPSGRLSPNAGLSTFATVDMRKYFPGRFDAKTAALACYHSAIPIALRIDGSFSDIARSAHDEFHGKGITEARGRAWVPFIEMMGDAIAASNPKQSMPLISSLGIADDFLSRHYGEGDNGVELLDVWLADTMMSATNLWMLHTWSGQLNLTVTYNEAYFPETQMDELLNRVRLELLQGLAL